MPPLERTNLKTGKRPVALDVRTYKSGDVLFAEGSTGRELFIIKEGKVGVFKESPDGQVHLANVEKDGMVGEMSLLDALPRSATVKAIDPSSAMVVNTATFAAALATVPPWLQSIIKIVVSRLRDANKRVDQAILRDKDRGLVSLIILLLVRYKHDFSSMLALDFDLVVVEGYFVCRLRKKEILAILDNLVKRRIVAIEEDTEKKRHVCIKDLEILKLYCEYLTLKSIKKTFRELSIPEESVAILNNIAYCAQKSAIETDDGTTLAREILVADLGDKKADNLDKILSDLKRRMIITTPPGARDDILVFKRDTLSRIKKIREWAPRFASEVGAP